MISDCLQSRNILFDILELRNMIYYNKICYPAVKNKENVISDFSQSRKILFDSLESRNIIYCNKNIN